MPWHENDSCRGFFYAVWSEEQAMDMGLKAKRVLLTGGSRGVGMAIARSLAREGASVAFSYINATQQALALQAELSGLGVKAKAIRADLGRQEDAAALYGAARSALGGLDILINNAAIWPTGWVTDLTPEQWQHCMDVNLTAPFLLSQAHVRHLQAEKRQGKVINITSQAAFLGATTGHAHYAASKAGLVAFTISLAREVAKSGITVNAVALGLVETDMLAPALAKDRAYYESRVPMGRLAQPDDVAGVVLFLASSLSNYMTGATVDATGGMLMR